MPWFSPEFRVLEPNKVFPRGRKCGAEDRQLYEFGAFRLDAEKELLLRENETV